MLRRYFRDHHLGVFRDGEEAGLRDSVVFQHALSVSRSPVAADLARSTDTRRLLLYGRPEAHAGRNLFEVAVTGLREAVANDVFDGDWEFDGVGSLRTEVAIRLGRGKLLTLTPRLPLGDYVESLRGYDVGLSLQYAPHPGVVHFEMAACGIPVVTNTFRQPFCGRPPRDLGQPHRRGPDPRRRRRGSRRRRRPNCRPRGSCQGRGRPMGDGLGAQLQRRRHVRGRPGAGSGLMFISLHIPKTAGTTLAYIFDYGSGRRIVYDYKADYSNAVMDDLDFWRLHKPFIERQFNFVPRSTSSTASTPNCSPMPTTWCACDIRSSGSSRSSTT